MITERDVVTFWLGPDGKVWELYRYASSPTCEFRRVDDHEQRRGGVVGSPFVEAFTRLVPESDRSHAQAVDTSS